MANLWLDLKGPILADTVYINGVLVAKDVTITLPAVTHVTADYKAMGTYTAPMNRPDRRHGGRHHQDRHRQGTALHGAAREQDAGGQMGAGCQVRRRLHQD